MRTLLLLTASLLPALADAQALPAPQAQQTRSVGFSYDETTGLLKEEQVEPGSPDLCVKTTHEYDNYGNRTKTTTAPCTGASGTAAFLPRSASSDHADSTQLTAHVLPGSYPLVTRNVLQHAERKKFNAAFGQVEELEGPNGLKTAWTYDEFGRKVRETRADNSRTEVAYCYTQADQNGATGTARRAQCDGLIALVPQGARPSAAATFTHTQAYLPGGAAAGPWSRSYQDRLGREIRSLTQAVGADPNLTHRADRILTRGWKLAA